MQADFAAVWKTVFRKRTGDGYHPRLSGIDDTGMAVLSKCCDNDGLLGTSAVLSERTQEGEGAGG